MSNQVSHCFNPPLHGDIGGQVQALYNRVRQILSVNIWLCDLDLVKMHDLGHSTYRMILKRQMLTTMGLLFVDHTIFFVLFVFNESLKPVLVGGLAFSLMQIPALVYAIHSKSLERSKKIERREKERYLDFLLSGFEGLSNSEKQALVKLCNVLSIPLTDEEFRCEISALIEDDEFPNIPLRHAMIAWLDNPKNLSDVF
jgi:hypothetical protein